MRIACDNLEKEEIKMNWWRVITLCKNHKKQWKSYKEKLAFVDGEYDRLLHALDDEIKSRKQIGQR